MAPPVLLHPPQLTDTHHSQWPRTSSSTFLLFLVINGYILEKVQRQQVGILKYSLRNWPSCSANSCRYWYFWTHLVLMLYGNISDILHGLSMFLQREMVC